MNHRALGFLVSLCAVLPAAPFAVAAPKPLSALILVGNIPGEYVKAGKPKETHFGFVRIKDRLITHVEKIEGVSDLAKALAKFKNEPVIQLTRDSGKTFDVLYPGLINLHNHTEYNILPVWKLARGQFENRFEWRGWKNYTNSVSGNMNPWKGYGSAVSCASFRWSEIQAMTLGTIFLQGPSSCVTNFGIHRVEDADAFISNKKAVQAPTDTIVPEDMTFVWKVLGPLIRQGMTYEAALAQVLTEGVGEFKGCPGLRGVVTPETVNSEEVVKILGDQDALKEACAIVTEADEAKLPEKFVRYVYWHHKTIASRKRFIASPDYSAIITHLAEGSRTDPYNRVEFEILAMLGLLAPNFNLVHAVGVSPAGLEKMAKAGMGIVWSPFSNLLLYGETLDLAMVAKADADAKKKGKRLLVALGSDWTPTGTKSVLEELQLARAYVEREKLSDKFDDEALYRMVTENPARMIGHWEIDEEKGEHGVGRIAVGAMGSLIAVSQSTKNPYENLVRFGNDKTINLVVVDGQPVYGNLPYLERIGIQKDDGEVINRYYAGFESLQKDGLDVPPPFGSESGAVDDSEDKGVPAAGGATKADHMAKIASIAAGLELTERDDCGTEAPKVFVHQDSLADNNLEEFKAATGLDLDRYADIQKFLGLNLMTQSRNLAEGLTEFLVTYFPPILSCNDPEHRERVAKMVIANPKPGESDRNTSDRKERAEARRSAKLGSVVKKLADNYRTNP